MRRRIKETAWEKQNQREGFRESFKPLISQFEKPEDSKKENIFTQNQKMLRNQLALTEGLRDNQLALTNKKELPAIEYAVDDDFDDYYNYKSDDFYSDKEDLIEKEKPKKIFFLV